MNMHPAKPIFKKNNKELVEMAGAIVESGVGGIAESDARRAQAELTRRLMEALTAAGKSTVFYSQRTLQLTVVLLMVGLIQVVVSVRSVTSDIVAWVLVSGAILYFIYDILRGMVGDQDKKEKRLRKRRRR